MSFTTPTVDVYVPGTTLGIGNVNAGTINIGNSDTVINIGESVYKLSQSGTTVPITTLTGSVSFSTPFKEESAPKVIVSLNLNETTIFIPIGVSSIIGITNNWTGFTWAAATTSSIATISWYATV